MAITSAVLNSGAITALGRENICAGVVRNVGAGLLVVLHVNHKSDPWQGRDIRSLLFYVFTSWRTQAVHICMHRSTAVTFGSIWRGKGAKVRSTNQPQTILHHAGEGL